MQSVSGIEGNDSHIPRFTGWTIDPTTLVESWPLFGYIVRRSSFVEPMVFGIICGWAAPTAMVDTVQGSLRSL